MDQKPPTLEELTTEQKHRTDAEYVAAVNAAIAEGQADLKAGKSSPADQVWERLGVKD